MRAKSSILTEIIVKARDTSTQTCQVCGGGESGFPRESPDLDNQNGTMSTNMVFGPTVLDEVRVKAGQEERDLDRRCGAQRHFHIKQREWKQI